jgi:hypothetical protein
VLHDGICVAEQYNLQKRPVSDNRMVTGSRRAESYAAHIRIDMVYRCLVYQDLWDGMGEIAWKGRG